MASGSGTVVVGLEGMGPGEAADVGTAPEVIQFDETVPVRFLSGWVRDAEDQSARTGARLLVLEQRAVQRRHDRLSILAAQRLRQNVLCTSSSFNQSSSSEVDGFLLQAGYVAHFT
jgi:hypothetical protein